MKILGHSALEGEKFNRHIETEMVQNNHIYFDLKKLNPSNNHIRTNSIIQRARIALKKLDITLKVIDSNDLNDQDDSKEDNNECHLNRDLELNGVILK